MASTLTPNMSLIQPTIGQEGWATAAIDLNSSLSLIDGHDHSSGRGVQIGVAGLNIQGDLALNGNNLTTIRALRMSALSLGGLSASDNAALCTSGVDLYYRDGNGNNIRLTQSGSIVGTAGSISGLTSPASASYVAATGTFVWQSAASTSANMDMGPITLRYVAASANGITLTPPSGLGASYQLTLPSANPGTNNALTLTSTAGNQTYLSLGSGGQGLRVNATGTAIAWVGPNTASASSSGNFSTTSTIPVQVTNQSISITTTGRPVLINVQPDGSGSFNVVAGGSSVIPLYLYRNASPIAQWQAQTNSNSFGFALSYVDLGLAAGTYTYALYTSGTVSAQTNTVAFAKIVAVEI